MENSINTRAMIEESEELVLSKYATLSKNATRQISVKPCDIRTEFQRDRDKIIHSKAFRRLKHKTQVFISPEGDHYRTRLTHTLEVMQISRTIARALRLNEDLTEAIALGHDLGHTPFGHSGESVLNQVLYEIALKNDASTPFSEDYFKHNIQSLRVVDHLEGNTGLNLTNEVRDGIRNHSGKDKPYTLEGKIVAIADRIAYVNHDIDDAIRAEIILEDDIPKESSDILGYTHKDRINKMIIDIINSSNNTQEIKMSDDVSKAMAALRKFMFLNVYVGSAAKIEEDKAKSLIKSLFYYYIDKPNALPEDRRHIYNKTKDIQIIVDYIAGMTDVYAISKYREFFIPSSWKID